MAKELIFNVPSQDEPGFFRRAIEVQEAYERAEAIGTVAALKELIEYLTAYVEAPKEQAIELLMDASRTQIKQLTRAIVQGADPLT